jgi:hypothetical protein
VASTSPALLDYDQRPSDWAILGDDGMVMRLRMRFLYAPRGMQQPKRPWLSSDPVVSIVEHDLFEVIQAAATQPGDSRQQLILDAVAKAVQSDGSDIADHLGLSGRARGKRETQSRDEHVAIDYLARVQLDSRVKRASLDLFMSKRWRISRSIVKQAVAANAVPAREFIDHWLRAATDDYCTGTRMYDRISVLEAITDLCAQVRESRWSDVRK